MSGLPEAAAKAAVLNYWTVEDLPAAAITELILDRWKFRADLVLCNQSQSVAIEIKTRTDSLTRLERQIAAYTSVFDYVYAAVAPNHLVRARQRLPSHVGILLIIEEKRSISIRRVRIAKKSPGLCACAMASLLPLPVLRRALKAAGANLPPPNSRREGYESAIRELKEGAIAQKLREFLIARYSAATMEFFSMTSGRPIQSTDIDRLRLWRQPNRESKISGSDDEFFVYLAKEHPGAFGQMPIDLEVE